MDVPSSTAGSALGRFERPDHRCRSRDRDRGVLCYGIRYDDAHPSDALHPSEARQIRAGLATTTTPEVLPPQRANPPGNEGVVGGTRWRGPAFSRLPGGESGGILDRRESARYARVAPARRTLPAVLSIPEDRARGRGRLPAREPRRSFENAVSPEITIERSSVSKR
jgi:hypothetical protein